MMGRETIYYGLIALICISLGIFFWPKSEASVFWQAVEAIAALIQVIFLFLGIRIIKDEFQSRSEERAARNYQSLLTVFENLLTPPFYKYLDEIRQHYFSEWIDPHTAAGDIVFCLTKLNIIQQLIDRGILDQELLFSSTGSTLYDLWTYTKNFEHTVKEKESKIHIDIRTNNELAFKLLKNYISWEERR